MPLVENIASFANYNTNCGLENTQFGRFINLIDGSMTSAQHGQVLIRKSGAWDTTGDNLIYEKQVLNLGNISGNGLLGFENLSIIKATLVNDVNFFSVNDVSFLPNFIYTFMVVQGGVGGYSINWPFGSKVIGELNKTAGATTIIQLYFYMDKLYVKYNVNTINQSMGTPVTLWNGNIFLNRPGFSVTKVNGDAANIGEEITGDEGGVFIVNADGSWTFDPLNDFENITEITITKVVLTIFLTEEIEETLSVILGSGFYLPPIHRYTFETDFNDSVGSLNFTNTNMSLTGGYVTGNGQTQYARIALNQHQDKWFTYSVWVERLYDFTHYQYIIGSQNNSTTDNSNYGWFLNFYNNKLALMSSQKSTITQPLNTPIHVVVVVNSSQNLAIVYENGEKIHDGGLHQGSIGTSARNIFQLGGFNSFTATYARGTKIYSLGIYDGILTDYAINTLYKMGNTL